MYMGVILKSRKGDKIGASAPHVYGDDPESHS